MKQKEEPPKLSERNSEKDKSKNNSHGTWIVTVIIIALVLSVSFTVITEIVYNAIVTPIVKLIVAILLVLLIIVTAIVSDIIGVAATSCDPEPLMAMASRKVKGAKRAVALCRNSDKVSSIFADIVSDVCSIISGASGATISVILLEQYANAPFIVDLLVSALISAIIAATTIGGKALFKRVAMKNASNIIFGLAKLLSVFDKK